MLSILRISLWLRKTTDFTWTIAWYSGAKVDNANGWKSLKKGTCTCTYTFLFRSHFFRNLSRFAVLKDTRSGAEDFRCWNLHGKVLKIAFVTLFGQLAWSLFCSANAKNRYRSIARVIHSGFSIAVKSVSLEIFHIFFSLKNCFRSVAFMIKTAKCIRLKCNWNDQAQFS